MKLWKIILILAVAGALLKALAPGERAEEALTAASVVDFAQRTQPFPLISETASGSTAFMPRATRWSVPSPCSTNPPDLLTR